MEHKNIYELLKQKAEKLADKPFLIFESEQYTYRQILTQVDELSAGLHQLGMRKGDKAAIILPNCLEFMLLYFAIAKSGAVFMPFNIKHPYDFIKESIGRTHTKFLFVKGQWLTDVNSQVDRLISDFGHVKEVITTGDQIVGTRHFDTLMHCREGMMPEPVSSHTDFAVVFTSGSTGKPKGVLHTQYNLIINGLEIIERLKLNQDDAFLFPFPLSGIFGIGWTTIVISAGASVVLMSEFEPHRSLGLIEKHNITVHCANQYIFNSEMSCLKTQHYNTESLRTGIIGGQVVDSAFLKKVHDTLGMKLCYCYGMTEAAGGISLISPNADDDQWLKTAGRPLRGVDIKIMDEAGEESDRGTIGEIWCKAKFFSRSYLIGSTQTPIQFQDGWFQTEDMGFMDGKGYLHVMGRKRDMFKKNNIVLFSQAVEKLLEQHPLVDSSAVVNTKDSLHAFVKTNSTEQQVEKTLKEYLLKQDADLHVIKTIRSLAKIPATATGKVDKIRLIKTYLVAVEKQ